MTMQLPGTTALSLSKSTTASPEQIKKASKELETQFASMLVKSMRSTTGGDPLGGNDTTYRDMYDQQLAKELTKGRGLGLSSVIEKQLSRDNGGAQDTKALDTTLPSAHSNTGAPMPLRPQSTSGTAFPFTTSQLPLRAPTSANGAVPVATGGSLSLASSSAGVSLQAMPAMAMPQAPQELDLSDCQLDCSSPEAFVQSIWPHAQKAAEALGVPAKALVAQAALETGWGRRLAGKQGVTSNNLFGIKAGSSWDGDSVNVATTEYTNGVRHAERANFRAYGSAADSFADYTRLLGNDRYAAARGTGQDTHRFATALQRAGYATDPHYASKLTAIANGATISRALANLPGNSALGSYGSDARLASAAPATNAVSGANVDTSAMFAALGNRYRAVASY
ncbi:flagellar protein FlgJ [Pseudoxanthomonas sp. GM95]|uniref:flagellar assembly peptidoglycan hydrolase FlgJ n=1 Tax=Pseudoxanthomonas sp. GM95 TaxID=1881043 RepID=UPI0008C5323B|nr:flagellar assembly peptidoglycan hydrolase FlgJ [Pseudoxanthomonas sp. GM95]SEK51374.1 flagellar protein FlgJ [Pseudoxanthomonas sp. GM95]